MDLARRLFAEGHVAIVAAHPDDEVIGAGAAMAAMKPAPWIVYATDGAPANMRDARALGLESRASYAALRREEALAALALAGVEQRQVYQLNVRDQESSFRLCFLAESLRQLFNDWHPGHVLTHAYEGGHPDHDSTAFAVHCAVELMSRHGEAAPAPIEFTSYHASATGLGMETDFIPAAVPVVTRPLSTAERQLKLRMLGCHRSQAAVLSQIDTVVEKFRTAPHYDFTMPPHAGELYYERFDWGMNGAQWRRLASDALATLFH